MEAASKRCAPEVPMHGRLRKAVPVAGFAFSIIEGVRMAQNVEADHHESGRLGLAASEKRRAE